MSIAACSVRLLSSVLIILALCIPGAAAERPVDMPAIFPGKAIAFAELRGLDAKLEQLRTSELLAIWRRSPQYQRYRASSDYRKLEAALQIAERQLGYDAWTAAKKLLGGNVAVGVYPKEGSRKPDVLVIVRTADGTAIRDLRQRLDPLLILAEDQIRVTEMLTGVEVLSFLDDAATAAWHDDWLAVSTSRPLLDEALARLQREADDEQAGGLADDSSYQTMTKSIDWEGPVSETENQRVFRGYVDTRLLHEVAGGQLIPEKLDNPLGSLLVGDIMELLRTSPYAAVTADVGGGRLSITTALARDSDKLGDRYGAFAPSDGVGVAAAPHVADLIGSFTLYRDFAEWYARREELLQEQVLPGFDKFETGLANILPGRDFGEDVLPFFGKRITFVAAPQDYSHLDGEPGVKVPGMAIIVELAQPDEAASLLQLFFQTLAAILNLEAGQQGRQPWVMASEAYGEIQVSYARYLQKPSGEDLGIVYNFLPASARVGDRYILSSSLSLCKQIIDSLRDAANTPISTSPTQTMRAELRFESLVKLIESDADFFVGRMAQDGRTAEEAQAEFKALLDLLRQFRSLQATTEVLPEVFQVRLEGSWK